jgi:hypothetical protein
MSSHASAAFEGSYSDWRIVKGRKVVQIVIEVPLENADHAYQVLGGMPNNGAEAWLAVARLAGKSRLPAPAQNNVAQQAAMRCDQPKFKEFLVFKNEFGPDDPAKWLREYFGVDSRKKINSEDWEKFEREYQLWLRA